LNFDLEVSELASEICRQRLFLKSYANGRGSNASEECPPSPEEEYPSKTNSCLRQCNYASMSKVLKPLQIVAEKVS